MIRYPTPMDWQNELAALEAIEDDDGLADLAAAAGVATAYHEPVAPEPRQISAVAMLLLPATAVCVVGIAFAVFG